MNKPRIVFCLDPQTVETIQEEFESRKTIVEMCRADDNPEAEKASKRIEEFISTLGKGEEIMFDSETFEDEEFREDFADEMMIRLDYFLD